MGLAQTANSNSCSGCASSPRRQIHTIPRPQYCPPPCGDSLMRWRRPPPPLRRRRGRQLRMRISAAPPLRPRLVARQLRMRISAAPPLRPRLGPHSPRRRTTDRGDSRAAAAGRVATPPSLRFHPDRLPPPRRHGTRLRISVLNPLTPPLLPLLRAHTPLRCCYRCWGARSPFASSPPTSLARSPACTSSAPSARPPRARCTAICGTCWRRSSRCGRRSGTCRA